MDEQEGKVEKKPDIKALVAVIPPATALKGEEKKILERRIRVRRREDVKPDQAKVNPKLAEDLEIKEYLEIIVAGKKKFRFKTVLDEEVPEKEVWCNVEVLKEHGIADNSIATVRAART